MTVESPWKQVLAGAVIHWPEIPSKLHTGTHLERKRDRIRDVEELSFYNHRMKKYLTLVYKATDDFSAEELTQAPGFSAGSWSHVVAEVEALRVGAENAFPGDGYYSVILFLDYDAPVDEFMKHPNFLVAYSGHAMNDRDYLKETSKSS